MEKKFTLELKQSGDEFYIEFNDEILSTTGWKIGDTLVWKERKDGSWTLKKKNDSRLPRLLQPKGV